jgi:hypothetical protein
MNPTRNRKPPQHLQDYVSGHFETAQKTLTKETESSKLSLHRKQDITAENTSARLMDIRVGHSQH